MPAVRRKSAAPGAGEPAGTTGGVPQGKACEAAIAAATQAPARRRTKAAHSRPFFTFDALPGHLKDNPHILGRYRSGYGFRQSARSLFWVHNETVSARPREAPARARGCGAHTPPRWLRPLCSAPGVGQRALRRPLSLRELTALARLALGPLRRATSGRTWLGSSSSWASPPLLSTSSLSRCAWVPMRCCGSRSGCTRLERATCLSCCRRWRRGRTRRALTSAAVHSGAAQRSGAQCRSAQS
jgi:hypothetical protein